MCNIYKSEESFTHCGRIKQRHFLNFHRVVWAFKFLVLANCTRLELVCVWGRGRWVISVRGVLTTVESLQYHVPNIFISWKFNKSNIFTADWYDCYDKDSRGYHDQVFSVNCLLFIFSVIIFNYILWIKNYDNH